MSISRSVSMVDRFNPRPHAGGDVLVDALRRVIEVDVSIHAPTRGATLDAAVSLSIHASFQSTPPRGGRHRLMGFACMSAKFQSTPPRGGRLLEVGHEDGGPFVSIHAPTRGATTSVSRRAPIWARFNPRPHAGGDIWRQPCRTRSKSFNPRPHAGGDLSCPLGSVTSHKFQSTPPRGGRRMLPMPWQRRAQFQSTPPRGGRRFERLVQHVLILFQSTPPRGGRPRSRVGRRC